MSYRFKIPGLGEAALWFADKDTLVIALYGGLDRVPERPVTDLSQLPLAVRQALKERIDPGAVAWLVGAVDGWDAMIKQVWFQALQAAVGEWDKDWLARLRLLRVAAIGAQLDPEARVQAALHCTDAMAAKVWRTAMVGPENAEPPAGLKAELEGDWLTVQWKGNLDALWQAPRK